MRNIEAEEGAASESSYLMARDEMELESIRVANSSNGNSIGMHENTRLHSAVLSFCISDDTHHSHDYNSIDDAMNQHMYLNMLNENGYSAIGIAVEYLLKNVVKRMLNHPSAHRLYLDYYPGDREYTVREIIMETYSDLEPLLPAPIMESLDSSDRDKKLLAALQHDEYNIFCQNLDSANRNLWYGEPYHSTLLEIACQIKNRKQFVKYLLDNGADPNTMNRFTGMPLLHATARSGNLDVLEILLKREKTDVSLTDNKKQTVLHWLARVGERKPRDKQILKKCLKIVLDSSRNVNTDRRDSEGITANRDHGHNYVNIDRAMSKHINVNMPNNNGYTAIGSAVEYLHKKTVKHMLNHPSFDHLYLDYYPGDSESTVREIIMHTYPDLEPLLPAPIMESLDSSERDKKLLAALQHDKYNIFCQNLDSANLNPWYGEPYHSTLLEIACQIKNRKQFVKYLLDSGADPNTMNRFTGMPLLHATARSGNLDVLKILLKREKTDISLTDNKKQTVLHWLARVGERKPRDKQILKKCLKIVLDSSRNVNTDRRDSEGITAHRDHGHNYVNIDRAMSKHINVNMPNNNGYTAIGSAVEYLHKKTVKHMLKHPSFDHLYLDYYPGDSESTVREIIMQTYPDLEPLLPAPIMESLDSSERDKKLLAALQHDEYNIFWQNLDSANPNPWYGEPYHSTLLEIACQIKNRKQFVKYLLDNGADPNTTNRFTGMPLLHATARSGNLDVLKILLKREKTDISLTDNKKQTVLHLLARVGERKPGDKQILENCFKLVLNSSQNVHIDYQDSEGITALYVAVKRGFHDRVLMLLRGGADIMLSVHGTPVLSSVNTPVMEAILDDCVESNDADLTSQHLKLAFKYEFLNKIMPYMAECPHQRESLKHPVTSYYLSLLYIHVTADTIWDIILYSICLLMQTFVILFPGYISFGLATTFLGICAGCSFLKFVMHAREHNINYILTFGNVLEFLMIIFLGAFIFDFVNSEHIKAIAIFLAWLKLVFMSWRLPWLAVQVEMFKRVSFTFFRYMAGYSLLVVTFALTFYIIFKGSSKISDSGVSADFFRSILQIIVMFAGEFEFSNLSFDTLPGTSHVIFLLFVFLVTIVLLNLLNGLAVGDTVKIREKAETLSLVAKVRILKGANIDLILQSNYAPRQMKEGMLHTYPNIQNPKVFSMFVGPTTYRSLLYFIKNKRQPGEKPKSTEEKLTVLEEKLTALEEKFYIRLKEMQEILNK